MGGGEQQIGLGIGGCHSNEEDLQCLDFITKNYNTEILSLCPTSPINQKIPLAPQIFYHNESFIKKKPKNYMKDFPIIPKTSLKAFERIYLQPKLKLLELEENIYFKLIKDLLKLPSYLKKYIRRKIEMKKISQKDLVDYN